MKHRYTHRLRRLEVQARPPFALPDDLSTLGDAALQALMAWCDRLNGPAVTNAIEAMTDAELAALVQMDDARAEAYLQERLR